MSGPTVRSDDEVFLRLAEQVSKLTGVILGEKQKSLVQSRLIKRFRDLGFASAMEYWFYYNQNREGEMPILISLLTTHHTFFFREWPHFEFLDRELPNLIKRVEAQGRRTISVWSAACSFGHEVYSLAMFLEAKLKALGSMLNFEILGTDVDEKAVHVAQNGVYRWEEVQKIPAAYLADHWARGTGDIRDFVKAKSSLKKHCRFKPANLLHVHRDIGRDKFDIIFCRNVFIYFSKEQIQSVVTSFTEHLYENGHLVLGLSESLYEMDVPVRHLGQSVYHKGSTPAVAPGTAGSKGGAFAPTPARLPTKSSEMPKPREVSVSPGGAPLGDRGPLASGVNGADLVRVICVDDSPSVLKLLDRLFTREKGFQVVGTASNGIEARALLQSVRADVMTLDIHMPGQDGIEYLRNNFGPSHPPVVMISSVARGDAKFALKALEYGASDYIEKPGLDNLLTRQDEILSKVSLAAKTPVRIDLSTAKIEKSFARDVFVRQPDKKLLVLAGSLRDKSKLTYIAKALLKPHPPVVVCLDALEALQGDLHETLSKEFGLEVKNLESGAVDLNVNRIYLAKPEDLVRVLSATKAADVAYGILGEPPRFLSNATKARRPSVMLVEEGLSRGHWVFAQHRVDAVVPFTSFAYDLSRFLADRGQAA